MKSTYTFKCLFYVVTKSFKGIVNWFQENNANIIRQAKKFNSESNVI